MKIFIESIGLYSAVWFSSSEEIHSEAMIFFCLKLLSIFSEKEVLIILSNNGNSWSLNKYLIQTIKNIYSDPLSDFENEVQNLKYFFLHKI